MSSWSTLHAIAASIVEHVIDRRAVLDAGRRSRVSFKRLGPEVERGERIDPRSAEHDETGVGRRTCTSRCRSFPPAVARDAERRS